MKCVSSRTFNQDISKAKRDAVEEPVFVTDRGKPTHVLMSVEAYWKLAGQSETLPGLLAEPAIAGLEIDWRALGQWPRGS